MYNLFRLILTMVSAISDRIPLYLKNSNNYYVVVIDHAGNYSYVNACFARRYSWITENFIGTHFSNSVHPEDHEKCGKASLEAIENPGQPVSVRIRKPEKKEDETPEKYAVSEWEFSAFFDEKSELLGILCVGTDITELARERDKGSAVLSALPDLIIILDRKLVFKEYFSTNFESGLYTSPENFLGKTVSEVMPEHIAKLAETSVERALASGVYVHTEYFLPDENGNPHYFELRCVKINNHEVMMIIRDITYTKLAKEEVTSAQETLYKLSLLAPGIFYTYKFKPEDVSEFLYVSPSISQMIQIHAKDVLNDAKIAFDTIYEEDLHYFTEQMMNSYKTLSPFQVEYRLAYDLNRHMNVTAVPEREKDGSVIWYGFITETTEQKRQLKEMKRTTDLVAMQNKRLLEFTYIVSHNLRSHAANLKGISDLLSEPTNESELQSYHEMLNSSVENLMTTLEHLNMIVKIQGETNLAVQKINLYDSINSTMESLQIMINSIGVEIDNRVPENFTIYFIFAYMESILLNLISNAIKYREPSRKLKITISAENVADGVWLYVADNGQGIDLERVGERMFGMYQVFHDHPESRGLGLFLCRNHMESVGGRIEVDSTPGQGATFKLFFPSGQ